MCAVYGPKRFYAEVIVTVFKTSRVAKRDDYNSKLLFFVKNKGQWNTKSGPKVADGNVAMQQNFRDVWSRNESVRAEIGQILYTLAAKLVVEMQVYIRSTTLIYIGCYKFCMDSKYYNQPVKRTPFATSQLHQLTHPDYRNSLQNQSLYGLLNHVGSSDIISTTHTCINDSSCLQ